MLKTQKAQRLRRILAIVVRQAYLYGGSRMRLLSPLVLPSLDIVVWGFTAHYLEGLINTRMHLEASLLGAVLLWNFLVRVMHGVTTTFLEDVWARNFLNLFATPLSVMEYVGGLALCSLGISSVGFTIMLAVAWGAFGLSVGTLGWMLPPAMFILLMTGLGLGILAAAMVLRFGPAAEWLVWPMPALLVPFSGVFYPISVLPTWMQTMSHAVAPAYVFEALRNYLVAMPVAAAGGGVVDALQPGLNLRFGAGLHVAFGYSLNLDLCLGVALSMAYVALACAVFARTFQKAVRHGLIARYSAESVI